MDIESEINRRRTFGIISHPDAGKTTLTEKLLLFGGAIQVAGAVKAKKAGRYVTSDFMEIEKQRGISVSTSVMGFEYRGIRINLLDTPGHEDFCEDTYRTLTAVDSVIMVIDASKGVESQTLKLLEVCRMRATPIITFINKLDRESRDPIELLDEVEKELGMTLSPMSWPIGSGKAFQGVWNRFASAMVLFRPHKTGTDPDSTAISDLTSPQLDAMIGSREAEALREELAVLDVYPTFNRVEFLAGKMTPIFFGSALNNFGIRELLDCFIEFSPPPQPRMTTTRRVDPTEPKFSGFIFKIHANIDPKHRDRIAYLRIVSGIFNRNQSMRCYRTQKTLKASNPTAFMAQEKSIIDVAYPGDIVGLHDTGNFQIGDSLTAGEPLQFLGIPKFSPEIFKTLVNLDPMKSKQLAKGISQLCEEGVAQVFSWPDGRKVVGTVGQLQFDVIAYRLQAEYGASVRFDPLNFVKACWVVATEKAELDRFVSLRRTQIVEDDHGHPVYLALTRWSLDREIRENTRIQFLTTQELVQ